MREVDACIIGAGPAGLSAAYRLCERGLRPVVVESHPELVGGLARTVDYKGFGIDIGGHRFFSKSKDVEDFWTSLLPGDLLTRKRSSKIVYRNKFFSYPLQAREAFARLGPWETARCLASFVSSRLRAPAEIRSFEEWVTHQFGARLYEIFFKTYTEKVWGMKCSSISADWAAQRISRLSLLDVVRAALRDGSRSEDGSTDGAQARNAKTLITSFRYPRRGPGMLWEACADQIVKMGGSVLRGTKVVRLEQRPERSSWIVATRDHRGHTAQLLARHVVSSAPIPKLVQMLGDGAHLPEAQEPLRFRDFLLVALIVRDRGAISDQWLYVNDPGVAVGRIQNYKAWSPAMVPDPALACYGMEYFCNVDDPLWRLADGQLLDLAGRELRQVLPVPAADVVDGHVIRQKKAYPVYDHGYQGRVQQVSAALARSFRNLHLVGRNGMHRYNNQDHSVMTGFLCAANIIHGSERFDLWKVNQDGEYLEEGGAYAYYAPKPIAATSPGGAL
jgi:protoporphyrinogen oxidase